MLSQTNQFISTVCHEYDPAGLIMRLSYVFIKQKNKKVN